MELEDIGNHLMTGTGDMAPAVLETKVGDILLDEAHRKATYVRARSVENVNTPEDFVGIAILIDVCYAGNMFLLSSYERHIFATNDDIMAEREFAILPIGHGFSNDFKQYLTENGFMRADVDDDADIEDVEETPMAEILPNDDT